MRKFIASSYIRRGVTECEQYANAVGADIVEGIEFLEDFANGRTLPSRLDNPIRSELVNVGSGTFQVWLRRDREICFRAMRAAQRG